MKSLLIFTSLVLGSGLLLVDKRRVAATVSAKALAPVTQHMTFKRLSAGDGPVGDISILVDKSDYELSVYDEKGWYATYPVVFGNNGLDDKKMEGDKKTPEGTFHIVSKRIHEKWYRFLALDYPTKDSWDKFKARKQRGEIPASASIGGGVGIHGTWPNEDFIIDKFKNWTLGCVSMKKDDLFEIYAYTPIGTKVVIRK